ncbi:MAG: S8 family serine peptidase, partial [bacterium]
MRDAIAYARENGCLVVAAAGNGHSEATTYPASDMNTLAVAAIDTVGVLSDFSNYGVNIDVCAPGTDVYAPYTNGIYAWWSGTSFATPFVTAQAALILAVYPDSEQPTLVEAIKAAARNIDSWNPELVGKIGSGLTDPFASLMQVRGTVAAVQVATIGDVDAGESVDVPIELVGVSAATGGLIGFDLLVDYDQYLLTLTDIAQGEMLTECDWEYFQHRTDTGLVRLTAIADLANGPGQSSCTADRPGELARLRFTVNPAIWAACNQTPLRFFWNECGDNAFVGAADPSSLLISNEVYENGLPINQDTTFPGYSGAPDECLDAGGVNIRGIDFFHGGIEFSCDVPDENALVVYPTSYNLTVSPDDSVYGAVTVRERHGRNISFNFNSTNGLVDLPDLTLLPSTPDSIFFSVSAAGLLPGNYYDTIVVTTVDPAVNSPAYVPVRLTVQEDPIPQDSAFVWPDTLSFRAAFGSDPVMTSCVHIGTSGETKPYYTGLVGYPVFVSNYAHYGWTNDTTCVSVDPSGLAPGVYYNHILYFIDSVGNNLELVVRLLVEGDSILPTLATLQVGSIAGAEAGQAIEIPIEVTGVAADMELSAFDVTVAFDQYLLTLYEVEQGAWLTGCSWEYFSFRTDGGLVRLVGLADRSGNSTTPSCFVTGPGELAILRFIVEPDLWAPCLSTPVRFFWRDCGHNALVSNSYPWSLLISKDVYQDGQKLYPDTTFPNYTGATNECLDPGGINIRAVDFVHGQVEFACPPGDQPVLVVTPTAYTAQVVSGDTLYSSIFVRELHDDTIMFEVASATGFVQVPAYFTPQTTPDSTRFYIPTAGLAPGTYYDTLIVSGPGEVINSPVRVPVTIWVQPGPDPGGDSIYVWPDTLFFTASGATDPTITGCAFLGSSVDSIYYEAALAHDTFIPTFISDFDSLGMTNDTICVTVDPGDLDPGFYYNHISYNLAGTDISTELVVILTVEAGGGGGPDSAFVVWDTLYLNLPPYDSTVIVDYVHVLSTNAPAAYTIQPVGQLTFTTLLNDSSVTNDPFCCELSARFLDTGYYADTLEVRVLGVDNNPLLHIFTLLVTSDSEIVAWATPDTLHFTAEFGSEPYLADYVALYSKWGPVAYDAHILAGTDGWTFAEFPDDGSTISGSTNDTVLVAVSSTVMPPGTYHDLLRFDLNSTSRHVFVDLALTIEG